MKTSIGFFNPIEVDPPARVYLDWESTPHFLIMGSSGSGKTWATKGILANLLVTQKNAKLWLCDYKAEDFLFCKGSPRSYLYEDCAKGLAEFFAAFEKRRTGEDTSRTPMYLCFDEFASWLLMLDKKAADVAKGLVANLLMLGRAFNVHVIIVVQRADAEYFAKSRDNFGAVLALGNLSKEAKQMFFSDVIDDVLSDNPRGSGYFLEHGSTLRHVIMPKINDIQKINFYISKGIEDV